MSSPSPDIIALYQREDKEIVLHETDESLDTITIPLPSLTEFYSKFLNREVSWEEAITYVDGYGLPPEKQFFKHQEMPQRLKGIFEEVFKEKQRISRAKYKDITDISHQDIYEELEKKPIQYAEEIAWIQLQIKRRYEGYWFFNRGKPYYLNGANYFFINFWKVKNKGKNGNLADYRDYQRCMFHLLRFAHTTTMAFYKHRLFWRENGEVKQKYYNDFTKLVERENELKELGFTTGHQKNSGFVVDMGKRTVNGVNIIAGRRIAKTAIACCYLFWSATNEPERTFIIQGLNKDQAQDKVFQRQIQIPFDTLPFFFKPYVRGREDTKSGYKFMYDGIMSTAFKAGLVTPPLNTIILPLSSNEKAADGEEITEVYRDEPGKELDDGSQDQDIPTWWNNTVRPATEQGDKIIGFCIMPTTVGNMDTGGGAQFLEVVEASHYAERDDNGTTQSGLINFLLPGYYAIPGFIDQHGFTIMEDPEVPVLNNEGELVRVGAKTYLQNKIDNLTKNQKWTALTQLLQNFPPDFKSAFSLSIKDIGFFPTEFMKERVSDLRYKPENKTLTSNIDFIWNGDIGEVVTDIRKGGIWTYSYVPPKSKWNKRTIVSVDDGYFAPENGGAIYAPDYSVSGKFFIGFDPVALDRKNKRGKGGSLPAAAIYYKRDPDVDPDGKDRNQWVSQDFVAFLIKRTDDKTEFYEEVLKAAILYGAYIYPEANIGEDFIQWVRNKGYDGYLLRDMDTEKNIISPYVGVVASPATTAQMFQKTATWFTQNVRHTKIWQIVEDWLQMRGSDDLTNHDLAAATGWALRAAEQRTSTYWKENFQETTIEIDDMPSFMV